jgi:hypothetical protein
VNAESARRRSRKTSGRRHIEDSQSPGRDADEHDLRSELRGRLHAVLQELDLRPVDYDTVRTILEGAVEAIDAAT